MARTSRDRAAAGSASAAPPVVDVRLPDAQQLRGRLYARAQTADGRWLYKVGLVVWRNPEREQVLPGEYRVWVLADYVRPVDGVDYSAVPTERHTPAPAPSQPPVPQGLPPRTDRWRVQRERRREGVVQRTMVHRYDCWNAGKGEELTRAQALEALARPGAQACAMCGADQQLRPTPGT